MATSTEPDGSAGPVLVVDARPLTRVGLTWLARAAWGEDVRAAATPAEAEAASGSGARAVLLGLGDEPDPAAVVADARARLGGPLIAAMLAADAPRLCPAIAAGIDGAVILDALGAGEMVELAADIATGRRAFPEALSRWAAPARGSLPITDRCVEVLRHLANGLHDEEVARELGISAGSVRKHVRAAEERLGARTRSEAVARALRAGLL